VSRSRASPPSGGTPEAELFAIEGKPARLLEDHPEYDAYWRAKVPDLEAIRLPMLVCASFSDQGLHTRGSFRAFRMAASEHKWLYTHRSLKWDVYYSREVQELTRHFFDCFVKGERNNGFLRMPPVRLEVRASRDEIHEVRGEQEWPPLRTRYRKLYLHAGEAGLEEEETLEAGELRYDAASGRLALRRVFEAETELTGYMKLRLYVEARAEGHDPPDDMTLFVCVDKLDRDGARVPFYGSVGNRQDAVARGLMRVSRRALDASRSTPSEPVLAHQGGQKLAPGEIVRVEVAIQPSSTLFRAGEAIELVIAGHEIIPSPPLRKSAAGNRGCHVVHVGGLHDSHLLIPVIPRAGR